MQDADLRAWLIEAGVPPAELEAALRLLQDRLGLSDDEPEPDCYAQRFPDRLPRITWQRAAVGAGKTHAVVADIVARFVATQAQIEAVVEGLLDGAEHVVLLAPTSTLARQIAADIRQEIMRQSTTRRMEPGAAAKLLDEVLVWEGWTAKRRDAEGEPYVCEYGDQMRVLVEAERSPRRLCQHPVDGETVTCEFFDRCPIAKAHFWERDQPRIVIATHALLHLGFGAENGWTFNRVVIDESFIGALVPKVIAGVGEIESAVGLDVLRRALDRDRVVVAKRQGFTAPRPARDEETRKRRRDDEDQARRRKARGKDGDADEEKAQETEEETGLSDEKRAELEEAIRRYTPVMAQLTDALSNAGRSGEIAKARLPELRDLVDLREHVANRARMARFRLPEGVGPNPGVGSAAAAAVSRVTPFPAGRALLALDALIFACGCETDDEGNLVAVYAAADFKTGEPRVVGHLRLPIHDDFANAEFKVLSATLEPDTLLPWFEEVIPEGAWTYPEVDPVERTQVLAGGTRSSLIGKLEPYVLTATGLSVARAIDELAIRAAVRAPGRGVLVVAVEEVLKLLEPRLAEMAKDGRPRAKLAFSNFKNVEGRNDYAEFYGYVSVGRTLPRFRDVKMVLEALTGGPVSPPVGKEFWWDHVETVSETKSGVPYETSLPTHSDRIVRAYIREVALTGPLQSDRSRAFRRDFPGERLVFCELALPEKFDLVSQFAYVEPGIIEDVADKYGLVIDCPKGGRGHFEVYAALAVEGVGSAAMRMRMLREAATLGPGEARVDAVRETARFAGAAPLRLTLTRPNTQAATAEAWIALPAGAHGEAAARAAWEEARTGMSLPEGMELTAVVRRGERKAA